MGVAMLFPPPPPPKDYNWSGATNFCQDITLFLICLKKNVFRKIINEQVNVLHIEPTLVIWCY